MLDQILPHHKEQFAKVIEHLHHELSTLRTGRAHTGLLASVMVESYGSHMPLQQVASVGVSDARTLTVSPWDKSQITAIEKGIAAANLGLNPSNDGQVIRLNLPPLTEERRKELVKLVNFMGEQARIGVRQAREETLKELKRVADEGNLSEDDVKRAEKKLQEFVDENNAEIKRVTADKETELMTV